MDRSAAPLVASKQESAKRTNRTKSVSETGLRACSPIRWRATPPNTSCQGWPPEKRGGPADMAGPLPLAGGLGGGPPAPFLGYGASVLGTDVCRPFESPAR